MSSDTLTSPVVRETRNIRADYLSGEPALAPFYAYSLQNIDFREVIADKQFPPENRQVLVDVLTDHYQGLEIDAAARDNLASLLQENTYTLTAGHQLNIFGGPLYTPYKVLTVAKLAQQLNETIPEAHIVPVFWIHTEDHDYEEINHYFPSFDKKVTYRSPFLGATGEHMLTPEIEELIPTNFPEHLAACFQAGKSLAEATLAFSMAMYGKYGVLVLDASDKRLKALFKDILRQELFDPISSPLVRKSSAALHDAGYPLQIHARDINLFYLGEGGRDRIVFEKDRYFTVGGKAVWNKSELEEEVENKPENFSPNVVLRPLYQEVILPNLAYTGGWGELSYWMQLKAMFDGYQINFPLLLPRMSATLLRDEDWKGWAELGLDPADVRLPLHEIYSKFIPQVFDGSRFEALSADLLASFDKMEAYIEELSATLPRSVVGQRVKTERFLKNTRKKIHRIIRHDQPQRFNEIDKWKKKIQPEGLVQERILGLGSFPEINPEDLLPIIWQSIDPLNFSHQMIRLGSS